jgi:hypothetical protein
MNSIRVVPQSFNNLIIRIKITNLKEVTYLSIESNLESLSNTNGVTGREKAARKLMLKLIKPYVDETSEDNLGNLITKNYACSSYG